jgi:VWFA-related protein
LLLPAVLVSAAGATAAAQEPPPRYTERVEVVRLLLDARVVTQAGEPVVGLVAADFEVRIDGKLARVESAQWVSGALNADTAPPSELPAASGRPPPADGRLIVLLFQKDLERSRILGTMRVLIEADAFLDSFTPRDRVAVLSFDSHLRIWSDFTNDLGRVRRLLAHDLLLARPRPIVESEPPSIVVRLGPEQARRTWSIEHALELIGRALEPLPGAKSVVLVGHGFGRLGLTGVVLDGRYDHAREALDAARATVFCLDVTQADYHSLEAGLQSVAEDTGGSFERTHLFTRRAMERVAGALAGHYVLIIEKPAGRSGSHRLQVDVRNRRVNVLAKPGFVD